MAIWQAEHIRDRLLAFDQVQRVELLGMTTKGDQILDSPLAKVGGKGLFVKELETALLDRRADIAVHSAKDVPMHLPEGLSIVSVCQREQPLDALVFSKGSPLAQAAVIDSEEHALAVLKQLPQGAVVGTSSLRRQAQLKRYRPDLHCKDLRGNVNTRLRKLDEGQFDAIILAAAGLQRLGFAARISALIPSQVILPAVGQGVLMIEYRSDDCVSAELIARLTDRPTALRVEAERAMNTYLNGGCQVPIAGFATLQGEQLSLLGRVAATDGSTLLQQHAMIVVNDDDALAQAKALGESVAKGLLAQGAQPLLDAAIAANRD